MNLFKKEIDNIERMLNNSIKGDKANAYIFLINKESRVTVMANGSLLGQAIALENARTKEQFRMIERIADQIAEIKKGERKEKETPGDGEI